MPFLSLAYSSKPLSWLLNERKRVGEEERRVGWGEEKEVARGRGTEGEAKKETKPELPELHRLPHRLTLGLHKSLQVTTKARTDTRRHHSHLDPPLLRDWGACTPKAFLKQHFVVSFLHQVLFQGVGIITPDYVSGGNVCNLIIRTCNYVVKILRKL